MNSVAVKEAVMNDKPIKEYVTELARQMGVTLNRMVLIDGSDADCTDAYILNLISGGKLVGTLLYRSELDDLYRGKAGIRLEIRVRRAIGRLLVLCR